MKNPLLYRAARPEGSREASEFFYGDARSNSERAVPSACVGRRLSAPQIVWNRSTRRAGARGGPRVGSERTAVRPSIDQVLRALATGYGLEVEDLMKGKRWKDNELRKVGMYLAKGLYDLKLKKIAAQFGTGSYGTVGWACHGIVSRMQADAKFRKYVTSIR